jgi:tetratricopeptide (TPR) repeat protein
VDHFNQSQQARALINEDRLQDAAEIYQNLINAETQIPSVYSNLAAIKQFHGNLDEAFDLLTKALQLQPDFPEALFNLGVVLGAKGDYEAAIESYRRCLHIKPNHAKASYNFALALKHQGRHEAAIVALENAVREQPHFPEACNNLGILYREQGDLNAARYWLESALQQKPDFTDALINLGALFFDQKDYPAVIYSCNQALALAPDHPDALSNLGAALLELGDIATALKTYIQAISLHPNHTQCHNGLGNVLLAKGDYSAAISAYEAALKLKPDFAEAHFNMGSAYGEWRKIDAAICCYESSLSCDPDYFEPRWNLGLSLLLAGRYSEGWKLFDCETTLKSSTIRVAHAIPTCARWDGRKLSESESLLIVSEQGLGDTLHFIRYVLALKNKGIQVDLCLPEKLHGLIQASGLAPRLLLTPEQAEIISSGSWVQLLSLPRHLGVSPEHPIVVDPYINSTEQLVSKWRELLSGEPRPVIGINWKGNLDTESKALQGRSLTLDAFAPMALARRGRLLSLQKGIGSEEMSTCIFRDHFVECQSIVDQTWDFLETAAIIQNCDLIVTSDTSVAHLAGAMAKPTWLLLHDRAEWRWGLEESHTFWYPSMKLFRQHSRGDWSDVFERVVQELKLMT